MHLGLTPVPQVGEPVPDGLVTVVPTLSQANHPAAQDEVLYLVLGHGDKAGYIWAGGARKEYAGGMAAGLEQGHCGGHSRQVSGPDTADLPVRWAQATPRPHSPWKAMMLAEMLASSSRMPGRVG